ncbi:hypothetical protein GGR56DRAFT_635565 [Xylariaceae sp. FL0804]|nr:hypothetical protein GGR56DRAFT_635565 [Xylariaceae sp. FL0804]
MLKLHIELNMADLIAKVVRADTSSSSYPSDSYPSGYNNNKSSRGTRNAADPRGVNMATLITANRRDHFVELRDNDGGGQTGGITKTVLVEVRRTNDETGEVPHTDPDNDSSTSSTRELQKDFASV